MTLDCFLLENMSDPTTQSNYLQIPSQSLHLEWKVDFENNHISGSITHDLIVEEDDVSELMCVCLYQISHVCSIFAYNP